MIGIADRTFVRRLLTLGCLWLALAGQHAAAVGGGTPDPSGVTLNQVLLGLSAEAWKVREHVGYALAKVSGVATYAQIAKSLRFMQATAVALIARIDYAMP